MIYRDDDINKHTDLQTLINIQKLFDKYNKVHTVSILMEGLRESYGIWEWLMTTPNIDIALHGWTHIDYSREPIVSFERALNYWYSGNIRHPKKEIKVFYPPWNKTSTYLEDICGIYGLKVDVNVNPKEVYNFHWWEFIHKKDLGKLEAILKEN